MITVTVLFENGLERIFKDVKTVSRINEDIIELLFKSNDHRADIFVDKINLIESMVEKEEES